MNNSTKIIGIGILVALGVSYQLQRTTVDYFSQKQTKVESSNQHNFDFLENKEWRVTNLVLKERLAKSSQWETFEGTLNNFTRIIDGYGNIDKFYCERDGSYYEASSIRIFSPGTKTWTIYWVDNISTKLTFQVEGTFKDGVGTFYGEELFGESMVQLRFIWSEITDDHARWEQAYFDGKRQKWEVNWIMEFEELTKTKNN